MSYSLNSFVYLGAAMALHEESGDQPQRKWLNRTARERRDLSASVEATMLDHASQGTQEEGNEEESSIHAAQSSTLIPPRLSLQSKLMTAIQPGGFVESATRAYTTVPPSRDGTRTTTKQRAVETDPATQNSTVFGRFAQRITSSLAALGTAMHPVAPSSDSSDEHTTPQAGASPETSHSVEQTLEQALRTTSGSMAPVRTSTNKPTQPMPGKQKLAGRTHKIRLETALLPTPDLNKPGREKTAAPPDKEGGNTDPELLTINKPLQEEEKMDAHSHTMDLLNDERTGTTSGSMPALTVFKGEVEATARGTLSGSGVIECGQRDVIISNTYITATSVVLVMLTTDPGPVVVQYVSLQPHVGFTVHLTAPAAMKASFNYVVLLGELF
jgi:hypothetical protein